MAGPAEPDTRLASIFDIVRADLAAGGLTSALERGSSGSKIFEEAQLQVNGESIGLVGIDRAAAPHEQLVALASQVQALVLENVRDTGRAVVWPGCPRGHQHPLAVHVEDVDEVPTWWCPTDQIAVAPIGDLAKDFRWG